MRHPFSFAFGLLLLSGAAQAVDISGTISSTVTIFEDSRLTGDVTCNVTGGPCIRFGASGITLKLNGYTMTGPADPPANCVDTVVFTPEDGISAVNQSNIEVHGPGVIQKFRRNAIFFQATIPGAAAQIKVKRLTSHHNCFSGLFLAGVTDSEFEEIVSVRNAVVSGPRPCGGNCIALSHNNRIRRGVFGGNGQAVPNNDFGIGLVGNSSGNLLEENAITGNTNGIFIAPAANGNVVLRNMAVGNPAVQVSADHPGFGGVDIQDLSPAGANLFEDNLCITYTGAGPNPCTKLPKFSGHRNTPQGSGSSQ